MEVLTTTRFIYVVRAGDTLALIAGRYHLSWRQLYRLNASVIGSNPNGLLWRKTHDTLDTTSLENLTPLRM